MALYIYKAYNKAGQLVEGEINANTEEQALSFVSGRDLAPLSAEPKSGAYNHWWQREVFTVRKKPRVALELFTRELASFSSAGLRTTEALSAMGAGSDDAVGKFASVLEEKMRSGLTLSEALSVAAESVPASYVAMISAGEKSGRLGDALHALSDELERARAFEQVIKSALVYPLILLFAALCAVGVAIFGVVPQLAPLIQGQTDDLPVTARLLLLLAEFSVADWGRLLLGLIVFSSAVMFAFRREPARSVLARLIDRLPMVGTLLARRRAARYCRSLGMMIQHGVGLIAAMRIAAKSAGKNSTGQKLQAAADEVRQGGKLGNALHKAGVLPHGVMRLIISGDSAGRLGEMTLGAATRLDAEIERRANQLTSILPTILTIIMGAIVAAIIASIFSVILSVNEIST